MRIWSENNPVTLEVVAWHTEMMWMQPRRTIYMDHRAHPADDALHTWQGFSTGEWVGDMLKVTTTHLKEGWIRRNGVPRSDKATMVTGIAASLKTAIDIQDGTPPAPNCVFT